MTQGNLVCRMSEKTVNYFRSYRMSQMTMNYRSDYETQRKRVYDRSEMTLTTESNIT